MHTAYLASGKEGQPEQGIWAGTWAPEVVVEKPEGSGASSVKHGKTDFRAAGETTSAVLDVWASSGALRTHSRHCSEEGQLFLHVPPLFFQLTSLLLPQLNLMPISNTGTLQTSWGLKTRAKSQDLLELACLRSPLCTWDLSLLNRWVLP